MARNSRLGNSMLNLFSGFAYRIFMMVSAFVVRTVFIRCLSADYLGINGLYNNILNMLSLADLGFGTAMVFSLYKPLAENDQYKLAQLLQLYKKVYRIIGTVVLVLGLALVPFLDVLIKDAPDVDGLTMYYLLYLGNSVVSYWFFAYRNSILQADQKAYIVTAMRGVFTLVKTVLQILLLLLLRNYTAYLLVQIGCTIAQSTVTAVVTRRQYPGIMQKTEPLPDGDRKRIFADVRALMVQRISFVALNGTDSVLTSALVGLRWVGLISNFQLIVDSITGILSQITSAISASMGNFFSKEDKEAGYQLFLRIDFMGFWLYMFCAVALLTLLNPFVELWLGASYTLEQSVVLWLVLRFFVACLMDTLSTTQSTLGQFVQDQYHPPIAAALNIILSIWLCRLVGVSGIFMATVFTRLAINLWYSPLVIHRDGFGRSVKPYYLMWLGRFALIAAIMLVMSGISSLVLRGGTTIFSFAVLMVLTALVPNAILVAIYRKNDHFLYYLGLVKKFLRRGR